ncbi:MAG: isocitrate lyase/PEP mutase family protein [Gammaproteobacteria bacterium]
MNSRQPLAPGEHLREALRGREILPFIGVYDTFSASVAASRFDALFVSGFGFAASYYGLPDIGFIAWSDITACVHRIRTVLPSVHLLVDIDDGYGDAEVACHVASLLEASGASGVVLEDQKRPRRCGHFDGKQILELDDYLAKLRRILATRRDLFVVARSDCSDPVEIERRVKAYAEAGADAILVDGLAGPDALRRLSGLTGTPFCFNQIAGGKSPPCTLDELGQAGAKLVIYSTPCLFAAQAAIEDALENLVKQGGSLAGSRIGVAECTRLLSANLARRDDYGRSSSHNSGS